MIVGTQDRCSLSSVFAGNAIALPLRQTRLDRSTTMLRLSLSTATSFIAFLVLRASFLRSRLMSVTTCPLR